MVLIVKMNKDLCTVVVLVFALLACAPTSLGIYVIAAGVQTRRVPLEI